MVSEHESQIKVHTPDLPGWRRFRLAIVICVIATLMLFIEWIAAAYLIDKNVIICYELMYGRGAVGIPGAMIVATAVVVFLAAGISGEIKVQVWGLILEGPAAPIMLWVVSYLTICLSIYMLLPEIKSVTDLPQVFAKYCAPGSSP